MLKSLLQQIVNSRLQNGHYILILVLYSFFLILLALVSRLFFLVSFGLYFSSFLLDFEYFFRGLQNALLDLFDFVHKFPLFHAYLPSISQRVDLAGSHQNVEISEGQGSSRLIIDDYIPVLFLEFLDFVLGHSNLL